MIQGSREKTAVDRRWTIWRSTQSGEDHGKYSFCRRPPAVRFDEVSDRKKLLVKAVNVAGLVQRTGYWNSAASCAT